MNAKSIRRRGTRIAAAGLALATALALAACGASGGGASNGSTGFDDHGRAAAGGTPQAPAATDQVPGGNPTGAGGSTNDGTSGGGGKPVNVTPDIVPRALVRTGQITVRVKDVNVAASTAIGLANGAGGYIGGDDRQVAAQRSVATLTLRVPVARFDQTLAAVAALGAEQSRTVSTQDVTSQVIDVASRIKSEQASLDRVRALFSQAKTIGDIISLESELTQREANLEALQAQQAALSDQTALSTITATLLGPDASVVAAPKPEKKGFVAGLAKGWHAFVSSLTWLATVIGALLPFLVVLALVLWAALFTRRRMRSRRQTAPAVAHGPLPSYPSSGPTETATPPAPEAPSGPTT